MPHPCSLSDEDLLADCDVRRTRGSGPGGQHRNKVETAIVITHRPTGVIGQASERRSQNENKAVAIERLRLNLAINVRCEVTENRQPSELWQQRRAGTKIQVSTNHADFPSILAEALDFVAACQFEPAPAAKGLEISTSQLLKLIKQESSAWEWLSREREKLGLHRLK